MGYDAKAVVEKKAAHVPNKSTTAKKRKPSAPPKSSVKCQKMEDPGSSFFSNSDFDVFVMATCKIDPCQKVSFL